MLGGVGMVCVWHQVELLSQLASNHPWSETWSAREEDQNLCLPIAVTI